jgi:hypothetical protein
VRYNAGDSSYDACVLAGCKVWKNGLLLCGCLWHSVMFVTLNDNFESPPPVERGVTERGFISKQLATLDIISPVHSHQSNKFAVCQ